MLDEPKTSRETDWLCYLSRWLPFAILGIVFAIGITEFVLKGTTSFMENGLTMITLGLGCQVLFGLHGVLYADRIVRYNDLSYRKLMARFPFLRFVPGLVRREPIEVQVWRLRAIGAGFILFGISLTVLGLLRL
ncbi:MAG: hypothetical protein JO112_20530 [Planctomycetes bacterium]|nr:hypothetical protein [Planctomycetota bacterium]